MPDCGSARRPGDGPGCAGDICLARTEPHSGIAAAMDVAPRRRDDSPCAWRVACRRSPLSAPRCGRDAKTGARGLAALGSCMPKRMPECMSRIWTVRFDLRRASKGNGVRQLQGALPAWVVRVCMAGNGGCHDARNSRCFETRRCRCSGFAGHCTVSCVLRGIPGVQGAGRIRAGSFAGVIADTRQALLQTYRSKSGRHVSWRLQYVPQVRGMV